jgi:hypothetical protein
MKTQNSYYQLKRNRVVFLNFICPILFCSILNTNITFAQNNSTSDTLNALPSKQNKATKERKFRMTTLTFGGNGL